MKEAEEKLYPLRFLRGYFPAYPNHPKHAVSKDPIKVLPGEIVALPKIEAQRCLDLDIAEKADRLMLDD
jgi:hypothetical protein